MKIILNGKFSGRHILEAFLSSRPALVVAVDTDQKYELVVITKKATAMKISPVVEVVWCEDIQLVPYKLFRHRKYLLFGPVVEKWKKDKERLRVSLLKIIKDDEYAEVNLVFSAGVIFYGEDYESLEVVPIGPNCHPEVWEKHKNTACAFLKEFGERLREKK